MQNFTELFDFCKYYFVLLINVLKPLHKKVVALPISRYKSTRYRLQGTEVQGTDYRVQGTDYRVQGTEVLQGTGYRGTGLRVQLGTTGYMWYTG